MLYGLFCSVSSLSPHPFFFLPTFIHLLSLVSVSPVLLLHNPCAKGVPNVLLEGGDMLGMAAEESR